MSINWDAQHKNTQYNVLLSIVIIYCYAECCHTECHYAKCRYPACTGAKYYVRIILRNPYNQKNKIKNLIILVCDFYYYQGRPYTQHNGSASMTTLSISIETQYTK